jgi:hypothetical protein
VRAHAVTGPAQTKPFDVAYARGLREEPHMELLARCVSLYMKRLLLQKQHGQSGRLSRDLLDEMDALLALRGKPQYRGLEEVRLWVPRCCTQLTDEFSSLMWRTRCCRPSPTWPRPALCLRARCLPWRPIWRVHDERLVMKIWNEWMATHYRFWLHDHIKLDFHKTEETNQ